MNLNGICSCGDVRYEIVEQPLITQVCHCTDCQRTTGSAFVIHIVICEKDLKIAGETRMAVVPTGSGAGCELHACNNCGVIVWVRYRYHQVPVVAVRAGTLEDTRAVTPAAHIFVDSKQPWVSVPSGSLAFSKGFERSEVWPQDSFERYEALPKL